MSCCDAPHGHAPRTYDAWRMLGQAKRVPTSRKAPALHGPYNATTYARRRAAGLLLTPCSYIWRTRFVEASCIYCPRSCAQRDKQRATALLNAARTGPMSKPSRCGQSKLTPRSLRWWLAHLHARCACSGTSPTCRISFDIPCSYRAAAASTRHGHLPPQHGGGSVLRHPGGGPSLPSIHPRTSLVNPAPPRCVKRCARLPCRAAACQPSRHHSFTMSRALRLRRRSPSRRPRPPPRRRRLEAAGRTAEASSASSYIVCDQAPHSACTRSCWILVSNPFPRGTTVHRHHAVLMAVAHDRGE